MWVTPFVREVLGLFEPHAAFQLLRTPLCCPFFVFTVMTPVPYVRHNVTWRTCNCLFLNVYVQFLYPFGDNSCKLWAQPKRTGSTFCLHMARNNLKLKFDPWQHQYNFQLFTKMETLCGQNRLCVNVSSEVVEMYSNRSLLVWITSWSIEHTPTKMNGNKRTNITGELHETVGVWMYHMRWDWFLR